MKDFKGTIYGTTTKNYIYADSSEFINYNDISLELFPCDTVLIAGKGFKEGSKIILNGEVKPTCQGPTIKLGGSVINLTEIELLK